ncbi:MAG: ferritin-like domain-containing protein [Magnetovibrionaceae bacterium]
MSLFELGLGVLKAASPDEKVRRTREAASAWGSGTLALGHALPLPDRPARPDSPELRFPRDMPKRTKSGLKGRIAFIHAIAHIELNAIDLAWDVALRFGAEMPKAFLDDWVSVADDEARHFDLLEQRLRALGSYYGALPAHDGLWEAAENTADDLLARLALVPMTLEARGLDTAPAAVTRLTANGDTETARIMDLIAKEEIDHVAAGVRWFEREAQKRGLEAVPTYKTLLADRFNGSLKPPFNNAARAATGMAEAYYA